MTSQGAVLLITLLTSLGAVTLCWLIGLRDGNNISLIDAYWGLGSFVHGGLTFVLWHEHTTRAAVIVAVCGLWSLGLAQSMGRRWWRERAHGGDVRYRHAAENLRLTGPSFWWKSYVTVVAPQAVLILLLNLPLQEAVMTPASGLSALDLIGIAVAAGAATLELAANAQLERFKRNAPPGSTLMSGVWAWSRHPNYFANTLVYVGCYVVALRDPDLWWTVVSPIAAVLILRFMTGVRMTDRLMLEKRKEDPTYLAYVARTPSFIPRPPR